LAEADLVLFVVDIRDGRMPLDEEVAQRLRYLHTPVVLVINKADNPSQDDRGEEFYKLGRGKPVYVSVLHNRNRNALLQLIEEMLPAGDSPKPAEEVMKIAVVGRPNTGKSTFINTLAHVDRVIVSEIPGTTRDAVDVRFELDGLPFLAIDTAGIRRKAKLRDNLDFYSIHRAERSVRRADVVLHFIDPKLGISRLDKQLADYIARQYKPVVFTVNKWDQLMDDPSGVSMQKYATAIQHAFRTMAYAPIAFITAKTGKNVKALLNLSQSMFKQAKKRVTTSTLNRVIQEAVEAHAPAMRDNRTPKIYYSTQVGTEPPTVVVFVNSPPLFDATYQRYLLNVLREKLPFRDIPIKLYLRSRSRHDAPAAAKAADSDDDDHRPEGDAKKPKPVFAHQPADLSDLDREVNELMAELDE
jgi:GTP-binding protein